MLQNCPTMKNKAMMVEISKNIKHFKIFFHSSDNTTV